jgi:glutaconyl-CoA/methylmalonyl-CoA decarboxylase subunit delta
MLQDFAKGIQITIVGMGLVFLLLALLWGLMTLLLLLDRKRATEAVPAQPHVALKKGADELSPETLAAVMVAVRMHRRIRRKQAAPAMRSHQPGTLPSRWVGAGRTGQNQNWQPRRR